MRGRNHRAKPAPVTTYDHRTYPCLEPTYDTPLGQPFNPILMGRPEYAPQQDDEELIASWYPVTKGEMRTLEYAPTSAELDSMPGVPLTWKHRYLRNGYDYYQARSKERDQAIVNHQQKEQFTSKREVQRLSISPIYHSTPRNPNENEGEYLRRCVESSIPANLLDEPTKRAYMRLKVGLTIPDSMPVSGLMEAQRMGQDSTDKLRGRLTKEIHQGKTA